MARTITRDGRTATINRTSVDWELTVTDAWGHIVHAGTHASAMKVYDALKRLGF